MSDSLPSNEECFWRIVQRGDFDARCHFQQLMAYAGQHHLMEGDFDEKLAKNFHSCFWELYLPVALAQYDITLKRGDADRSEPDFVFMHGNVAVFVEAVACGEPQPQNRVPLQADADPDDFEASGLAPEERIMQRIATSVQAKILAVTRSAAQSSMEKNDRPHWVVIAVNGRRAIRDWPHEDSGVPFVPLVAKMVFGLPEERIDQSGRRFWPLCNRITKGGLSFPIAHFDQPTWHGEREGKSCECDLRQIAGILYSATSVWDTARPLGEDFIFAQNPHGPDATQLFSFCKRGVWVRQNDYSGQYSPVKLSNNRRI
jgi:hypothetical protein